MTSNLTVDQIKLISKLIKLMKILKFLFVLFQDYNGKTLKCVAFHDAFPRKSLEVATRLNILYAPIVRLERDEGVLQAEAEIDQIRIRSV